METNLKSTQIPQSHQTRADGSSAQRSKTPTLHVQTGIRAGGWREAREARRAARSSSRGYWQGAEIR